MHSVVYYASYSASRDGVGCSGGRRQALLAWTPNAGSVELSAAGGLLYGCSIGRGLYLPANCTIYRWHELSD